MIRLLGAILTISGCQGEPEEAPPSLRNAPANPYVGGFLTGQFCGVQSVFQVTCVAGCHSAAVPGGGLDLETDPYGATVGVRGSTGALLVEPGSPSRSLLYLRMVTPGEGVMPPTGVLEAGFVNVVADWITNGAPDDCDVETPPPVLEEPGASPHPPGWVSPEQHGTATNLQTDGDCRICHGVDLTGREGENAGISCDTCHADGWRTNCTFCHGGVENATGAPPQDIDGSDQSLAFPPHGEHVTASDHPAYACTNCHPDRSDVLDPGHVFGDVTPTFGELDYTQGLSPRGTYLFGTCSNLYCHGDGRGDNGTVAVGEELTCRSCHPDERSNGAELNRMSGRHLQHLNRSGVTCADCHGLTADATQRIVDGTLHVDGVAQVQTQEVAWDGETCEGTCHGHEHDEEEWRD